jgi:Cu/Ag efflux protein CusF
LASSDFSLGIISLKFIFVLIGSIMFQPGVAHFRAVELENAKARAQAAKFQQQQSVRDQKGIDACAKSRWSLEDISSSSWAPSSIDEVSLTPQIVAEKFHLSAAHTRAVNLADEKDRILNTTASVENKPTAPKKLNATVRDEALQLINDDLTVSKQRLESLHSRCACNVDMAMMRDDAGNEPGALLSLRKLRASSTELFETYCIIQQLKQFKKAVNSSLCPREHSDEYQATIDKIVGKVKSLQDTTKNTSAKVRVDDIEWNDLIHVFSLTQESQMSKLRNGEISHLLAKLRPISSTVVIGGSISSTETTHSDGSAAENSVLISEPHFGKESLLEI